MEDQITKRMNDIHTFMSTKDNETCLSGTDENGKEFMIWFNTIDLLESLRIDHMKEKAKYYINNL